MPGERETLTHNMSVLYVSGLMYGIAGQLWTPFWVLYIESLGATLPQLGLVLALGSVTGALMILSGGFLSDKFGRKKLVVVPGYIAVIGFLVYALANSWDQLLLGAVLVSFNCMRFAALQAIQAESTDLRRHAQAYAGSETALTVPGVIMPVLAGSIIASGGVQAGQKRIFAFAIGCILLANTVRAIFLSETLTPTERRKKGGRHSGDKLMEAIAEVFSNRSIRAMLVSMAICSFASEVISPLLVLYCVRNIGLSETEFGIITSVSVAAMIGSRLPIARFSDRFGRRASILIGGSLYPISIAAYFLAPNFHWLIFASALGSVANSFTVPARSAYIAESVRADRRARTFGVIASTMMFSTVPAPIVGTLLWDRFSPAAAFGLCIVLCATANLVLLAYLEERRPLRHSSPVT